MLTFNEWWQREGAPPPRDERSDIPGVRPFQLWAWEALGIWL